MSVCRGHELSTALYLGRYPMKITLFLIKKKHLKMNFERQCQQYALSTHKPDPFAGFHMYR